MRYKYKFNENKYYKTAMTHISLANDENIESNQRLEFLGDSVLSFIEADNVYKEYPGVNEGVLTELRANAVCEKALAFAARELGLGDDLMFGRSERKSGGADKDSVLADAYEAVLAAIYLDGGIETARNFVMDTIGELIGNTSYIELENYKSEIQSYYQKRDRNHDVVRYELISKTGPDHNPTFKVRAVYQGKTIGEGEGKNRKSAEQAAAKEALSKLPKKNVNK